MLALPEGPCETCLGWKETEGSPAAPPMLLKDTLSPEGTQRGAAGGLEAWTPVLSFHSTPDWERLHFLSVSVLPAALVLVVAPAY